MQHLPWSQALTLIHDLGKAKSQSVSLPLEQALNLTLAEDLFSPLALPHYSSSAMDGYAFAGSAPWQLLTVEAADPHENIHRRTVALAPGYATPILTGGLLPEGCQAVLRLEEAELKEQDGLLWLYPTAKVPQPQSDMRFAGEELPLGAQVASCGDVLSPRLLAFLAVCGFDRVPVYPRPKISLAYTGNEVITSGLPGPGEVRDAYSVQFPYLVEGFGAQVLNTARLHDDESELEDWFFGEQTASSEILVLTGGSSTSEVDLVRRLLTANKANYIFEAVAVRPGHPCMCALLPDGRLVLGLPGNPLAAHTSLYSYLPAYLAGYRNKPLPEHPEATLTAPLTPFAKEDTRLVPAQVDSQGIRPLLDKSKSHMLSAFSRANALLIVPPEGLARGAKASYLPLSL